MSACVMSIGGTKHNTHRKEIISFPSDSNSAMKTHKLIKKTT